MARVKASGTNKVRIIGKNYEQTLTVDPKVMSIMEAVAPKIAYNNDRARWDVYEDGSHTTLQRHVFASLKKGWDGDGRIRFENGDNTDFRKANLVA